VDVVDATEVEVVEAEVTRVVDELDDEDPQAASRSALTPPRTVAHPS